MARGAVDSDQLAAMSATLVHRGPDSFGEFSDGDVALAARFSRRAGVVVGQLVGNRAGD